MDCVGGGRMWGSGTARQLIYIFILSAQKKRKRKRERQRDAAPVKVADDEHRFARSRLPGFVPSAREQQARAEPSLRVGLVVQVRVEHRE